MKKLLFIAPLILLSLSFLPFSLYKDKVDLSINKDSDSTNQSSLTSISKLSPSHWKTIEYSVSFETKDTNQESSKPFDVDAFINGDDSHLEENTPTTPDQPKPEPLYQNATFRGFPFGAYFSKTSSSSSPSATSNVSASGYSVLWGIVDVLLVLVLLVVAIVINRKKKVSVGPAQSQAINSFPTGSYNPLSPPANKVPQSVTGSPNNLVTPSQPQIYPAQEPAILVDTTTYLSPSNPNPTNPNSPSPKDPAQQI